MDKNSPIGVFDSGAGGVSFLKTAVPLLPNEHFIYYGDLKNAPYGEKSQDEIRRCTHDACAFLYARGVKAIVMACNTATSLAVNEMREQLNIPVLSMEPAVKPALAALETGNVLVLATPATVAQPRYNRLIERLCAKDLVVSVGCGGLAGLVDELAPDAAIGACLSQALAPRFGQVFDAIVLGCTHYLFIKTQIAAFCRTHFAGKQLFFDGNEGTARHLICVLKEQSLLRDELGGSVTFYTSGTEAQKQKLQYFYQGK